MDENERFRAVDEIFREALREPPAARAEFVAGRCGGDEPLRERVLALLAEDERSRGALDQPALAGALKLSALGEADAAEDVPEQIGAYRIVARIGVGGMGTVYEAEQQNPRRQVAVKVISHGVTSPAMLKRFAYEAQLLGRLQHPGIAQIYEAGVHEGARGPTPYFAMELVRGKPLLEFAKARGLGVPERLRLIALIADAVHHAHQRGVIHRDLKPANILVDEAGRPRVLDFGIARAVDPDSRGTMAQTEAGQLVGTVSYMSPEQAGGDSHDLDTRTDVYSLGVVAYELLAGRLPYETEGRAVYDVVRIIREVDPTPLSAVNRVLRGDVQTILAKALEKEKPRRYDSAAAFAEDIRRCLADQPVSARAPSTFYQMHKFARRHRAAVVGSAAVVLSLVAGLVVTGVLLQQTRRALAKAERQSRIATAVQAFMNDDIFGAAGADRLGPDATIKQAIDAAASKVDARFRDEPEVAAAVHASLGGIYWSLGELGLAESHLLEAKDGFDRSVRPDNEIRLYVLNELARYYLDAGVMETAEALLAESIPLCRAVFGPDGAETFRAESDLIRLRMMVGEFEKSEALLLELLPRAIRLHGEQSAAASGLLTRLGSLYLETDRPALAEPYFTRALASDRARLGPEHSATLDAINNVAVTYEKLGRLDEAASMHEDALARMIALKGRHHPETLPSLYNLASVYYRQGRYDKAEPLLVEVLAECRKTLGEEHIGTIRVLGKLGDLYVATGQPARAEPLMRDAAEFAERALGPNHPEAVETRAAFDELRNSLDSK